MKRYLLDSNICIFFLKGRFDIQNKIVEAGEENCFISEITVAELKYGVENSSDDRREQNREIVTALIKKFNILPIYNCLDIYAKEKARLKKEGKPIDDFDLLIGTTAIFNDMIMVTNNLNHFNRIANITLEDWTI
ncbi:type II toxin-antitoxin system VapC family toxin [Mucilaginibacter paludis]|uniref:PilT protein domain protein n=1 Tax=Mucilaginibacter paludis DSM 18603 TaxID=714943 RepID=H1Y7G0_9SPHI|nr:type II toxin-antitoxin system VapC family toxin [Mucilaginibacter paludis]EHQ29381.1 PilT protein domain protein [Mucilaginibacter paludis DSM 18603]